MAKIDREIPRAYHQYIKDSVPLTPEEEKTATVEQLVNANLRFVVTVALTDPLCQRVKMTAMERIAAGNYGLLTAAQKFDPERGFKFITYAVWWIRQAILKDGELNNTIRIPANVLKYFNIYNKYGPEGLNESELERVDHARSVRTLSLDYVPGHADMPLSDVIRCPNPMPDEELEDEDLHESLKSYMENRLTAREAQVIDRYYGLTTGEPVTLEVIGMEMKVTRERVRQIKEIALRKLRHPNAPTHQFQLSEMA
jgi:RNA polymerase primary sigma factor